MPWQRRCSRIIARVARRTAGLAEASYFPAPPVAVCLPNLPKVSRKKGKTNEYRATILAASESSAETDTRLGLIQEKILEKTNRALDKPIVSEVLFSKFNFVER